MIDPLPSIQNVHQVLKIRWIRKCTCMAHSTFAIRRRSTKFPERQLVFFANEQNLFSPHFVSDSSRSATGVLTRYCCVKLENIWCCQVSRRTTNCQKSASSLYSETDAMRGTSRRSRWENRIIATRFVAAKMKRENTTCMGVYIIFIIYTVLPLYDELEVSACYIYTSIPLVFHWLNGKGREAVVRGHAFVKTSEDGCCVNVMERPAGADEELCDDDISSTRLCINVDAFFQFLFKLARYVSEPMGESV